MKKEKTDTQLAYHVSNVSVGANTLLSLGKILAGVVGRSGALVSDGIHSATDVVSSLVGILGIKLGNKKADSDHEYGHEKLECIVTLVLGGFILFTGFGIGFSGIEEIISGNWNDLEIPSILALIVGVVSIIVKEGMYFYTIKAAKKTNSTVLKAQAWDHQSDAISSIGVLVGIGGAMLGFPILDPLASIVISFFIIKAAVDILRDSTDRLVDKSCKPEVEEKMVKTLKNLPGVYRVDGLKTRLAGNKVFVDAKIAADEDISFIDSHNIAEKADSEIKKEFPEVKSCMVHISPVNINKLEKHAGLN